MNAGNVLEVEGLSTYFYIDEGVLKALDGVTFAIGTTESVGFIGESGCGKSATALSILRIVQEPGRIVRGRVMLRRANATVDILSLDPDGDEIHSIRGDEIAMIFQEPMTSLSPIHTIGAQVMEAVLLHTDRTKVEARERALEMLSLVGISNPSQRIDEYPHQLSGGMRQRAMIAMALACDPQILIADEPTTSLDVTVQAQILNLIDDLRERFGMSVMFITHDLGVISETTDRVNVMYLGHIVEQCTTVELFEHPQHPYTRELLKSIPRVGANVRERLHAIRGSVPIPLNLPWRCPFFGRCPEAMKGVCDTAMPELVERAPGHSVRCFLHGSETEMPHE